MGKTLCFTGHRPNKLYGYNDRAPYNALLARMQGDLKVLIDSGFDTFITGGAQGADQLAFWAVEGLKRQGKKIRNVVYVPFKMQPSKWSETGLFSQAEYKQMLDTADDVVYVDKRNIAWEVNEALKKNKAVYEKYGKYDTDRLLEIIAELPKEDIDSLTKSTGTDFSKLQIRIKKLDSKPEYNDAVKMLTDRNHAMVDASDAVYGVYQGTADSYRTEKGGTAECLRYARNAKKEILLIMPHQPKTAETAEA